MVDTAANHAAQGTGEGLLSFLDYAMEKGYLKIPTGQAMKTACKEVLSATAGDHWESADLASLDIEDTLRRFETLRAMKFSTGSLNTYKGRFKKSVTMFEEFRCNPSGWRPDVKPRNRMSKADDKASVTGKVQAVSPPRMSGVTSHSASSMITYPFPLRDGVLASLQLPSDLTKREATRLSAFIDSLAIDEQVALPPGQAGLPSGTDG
jgi:hypothetical protein